MKAVWLANWKPVAPTPTPTTTGVTTPSPSFTTKALSTEAAKGASSSFFDFPLAPMDVEEAAEEGTLEGHEDELDKYLALPVEKNTDLDVLAWWKAKDCKRAACQFLPRWHASSLAARPRLRALSVCSRRRASSMAQTRRPKRMGPSSTASLPPPTPSSRDERARTSGAREAARGVTGVSGDRLC